MRFLVNLQRLLNEGLFSASYEYALLLAITDLCIERGDDSGDPLVLDTRDLAEKLIFLSWPQARPYVAARGEWVAREEVPIYGAAGAIAGLAVLKQNIGEQATIIDNIGKARTVFAGSLAALRGDQRGWRTLVTSVAATVANTPSWKLQTVRA